MRSASARSAWARSALIAMSLAGLTPRAAVAQRDTQRDTHDSTPDHAARMRRIDAAFAPWSGTSTPGCTVAAEQRGRLLFSRAYGMANLELGVPVTAQSVFEAGSASKQFTAAAILLLVDDGKLRLSDDVRRYVPELPEYSSTITIDHLLTHSSGLSDWGTIMFYSGWPRGDRIYSNAAALEVIARQPTLIFTPGTFFSYTNSGYTLLAEIVGRVSGVPFAEFTEARMFKPLGMRATRWRTDFRAVVPHRTTAYRSAGSGWAQDMPFEHTHGHAGLLTTVDDLLLWNRALTARRFGAPVTSSIETAAKQQDGRALPYGRGLWVGAFRGAKELSHGGATAGYRAWVGRYPDSELSIALLCNGPANDVQLGHAVAQEFLPAPRAERPAAPAPAAPEPAPDVASSLAGHFERDMLGTPLTVTTVGGRLLISGEPAVPIGANRFRISWGDFRFEGRDELLELDTDGTVFQRYSRIDGPIPDAAVLRQVEGQYRSAATGASYLVRLDAARLVIDVVGRPGTSFTFVPIGPDTFRATGSVVRAHRDGSGRVVALTLSTDRLRDLRLVRE